MITKLKKISKSFINNLYMNYTYKKIIRNSKKISYTKTSEDTELNSLLNNLNESGAVQIEEYISDIQMVNESYNQIYNKIELNKNFQVSPIYVQPEIYSKESIAEKILLDKKLTFLIKNYLGEDAYLDIISASITKYNSQRKIVSEKWHFDNVGRRLKLFLYLNSNNLISTDYILNTNNLRHKNYTIMGSRLNDNKINKYVKDKTKFFPKEGSLFLFDTNGYHRGNFDQIHQDQKLAEKNNLRIMLKFEFSSKLKSDMFFGKSDIIGPRSTFFSNDFNFDDCELINKECLTKVNNIYFYDKNYSINR